MLDPALLEIHGTQAKTKYVPLATIKFIGGLQTQRSPFASIDTRYNSQYLGGKPDALIAGSNVEISNSLTLQRRPGNTALGPSIPAPLAFFEYKQSAPVSAQTVIDTVTAVYNYSSIAAGIIFIKSPGAGQTNFMTVVNTLYMGNGVDLYKLVGPNLLKQSNTFTNLVWQQTTVASVTPGQFDPLGGLNATTVVWGSPGVGSKLTQLVTPNYTPVPGNTFTISIWARASTGTTPFAILYLSDQTGTSYAFTIFGATSTWTKYQVTGTLPASSTAVSLNIGYESGTVATPIQIYGAQLEIGGPATPTQITTDQPQGVYLWGIVAPTAAPAISSTAVSPYWQASHTYNNGDVITDSNGNQQVVTAGGPGASGATAPTWAITVGSTTTDNVITWTLLGPNGLTPHQGYQWYYAFLDQYTGQPSNVSPISANSSTLPNNLGVAYTLTGTGSFDPQVDQIAIYRNTDGGPFFFQVGVVANPGGGTWTFVDSTQDDDLSSIYAPIGLLNTPPPVGAVNPVWYQSRAWVSVGSDLFFSSSTDNAAILNIVQNGVVAESFAPANVIPLDQLIVRSLPTSSGLLVQTISDFWLVTGSDLSSFNPVKALIGHGIRSYNATDSDGSTIWAYTSDRQFLSLNASAGSIEVGYAIGDGLTTNIDPLKAYVVRHVAGSLDNAVFLADGATGWYRMNPNQVGASVSGEPTTVWSPFATIVGGVQAIGSVETSPGVHQFLLGFPGTGSVLSLGQLAGTGANSGSGTAWANPNNLTLNNPATPATVSLNSVVSPSGVDVSKGSSSIAGGGNSTAVSTGAVTTGFNNELAVTAIASQDYNLGAPTITAGAGWTVDFQANFGPDNLFYYLFGSESKAVATAGSVTGNATLNVSSLWFAALATFVSNTGAAPTVVQKKSGTIGSLANPVYSLTLHVTPTSAITQGNFLIISLGCGSQISSISDSLGNVFTKVIDDGSSHRAAIYIAPITVGGSDTITIVAPNSPVFAGMTVYEVTLPTASGSMSSQLLQATNFNLNVPNNNIVGVKTLVLGSQTSSAPDATITLSWISPVGAAPSYTFQLPLTTGLVSFGGPTAAWGQTLTAALLNNSGFGFQLQANVAVTPNVTFNVAAVFVQVFYLNGAIATFPVLFRNLSSFLDDGSAYTWSATIGSLMLAYSGTLAEVESVATFYRASSVTQPTVAVLLDEITGAFETLPNAVNDPTQLTASVSVLGQRFYLSQGTEPPLCQHVQIQLAGGANNTKDELLMMVVRGAIVPEQES